MRNKIVPISTIIQQSNGQQQQQNEQNNNQQQLFQQISQQQEQDVNGFTKEMNELCELKNTQQQQSKPQLSSLQQLNNFLEKMQLEDEQEEEQQLKNIIDNNNEDKTNEQQQQQQQHQIIQINQNNENIQEQNKYNINVINQQEQQQQQHQQQNQQGQQSQQEQKVCKICLEEEDINKKDNRLLTPCKCQGSIAYIHSECLKTWIVSQGYDLFAEIRCELCNEEYEMEIEISRKCMSNKICYESKWAQLFAFFWLIIFMLGNLFAIGFLIYYKITNEDSQWGYIIMALAILILFEIALILLSRYYGIELMCGLYVKKWEVLNYIDQDDQQQLLQQNQENDYISRNIDNPYQLNPNSHSQMDNRRYSPTSNMMGRRSYNQIRIIQSRSVLSNYNNNQDPYYNSEQNQNNNINNLQKSLSRYNQSRPYTPQDQQDNYYIKALNNSRSNQIESKQEYNNNYLNCNHNYSYQMKNMSMSQIKANLGLDDSHIVKEQQQQQLNQNQSKQNQIRLIGVEDPQDIENNNNNISQQQQYQQSRMERKKSDEELLNFIKNNIDLYSNIVKAYNKIDNQFILQSNEIDKNMTVLMSSQEQNNISKNNNINQMQSQQLQSPQLMKKGRSSHKIIHLPEEIVVEEEQEQEEVKNNNDQNNKINNNFKGINNKNESNINSINNTPKSDLQQQNSLKKRNHHLLDIFSIDYDGTNQIQSPNNNINNSNKISNNHSVLQSNNILKSNNNNQSGQNPLILTSEKVQIVSQTSRVSQNS